MSIPYYEKDAGIKTHSIADGGCFYVVLDRFKVEAVNPQIWEVFESVRQECQKELGIQLDFGVAFIAISPSNDETFVLNLIPLNTCEGVILQ